MSAETPAFLYIENKYERETRHTHTHTHTHTLSNLRTYFRVSHRGSCIALHRLTNLIHKGGVFTFHTHTHIPSHTHTPKRLMSTENPALLYSEKEKIEQTDWRYLSTETRCESDSQVCTKVRRGSFSCLTANTRLVSYEGMEKCFVNMSWITIPAAARTP